MIRCDVIIPARNEEHTIRPIIRTFSESNRIGNIIVVVDADTTDHTAFFARDTGAAVVMDGHARGKGQCIKTGLYFVNTEQTVLCDADLTGLTGAHVEALTEDTGHTVGVADFPMDDILTCKPVVESPDWFQRIMMSWPVVSGERNVPTHILQGIDLHGYLTETQINTACSEAGIRMVVKPLPGLRSPFIMTPQRVEEMLRDRAWGIANGVLPGI
jgi:glycosyltransferase involved in cell wall biosynthesis